jgi:exopolysaccharide biosynthesis polyprenyl glycosylphosphotransferase
MFRRFSANFALFSIALDMAVICLALLAAVLLRAPLSGLPFLETIPSPVELPALLYAAFPLLWTGILLVFSVYDGRRNLRVAAELGSLTIGSALATISLAGVLYLSYRDVSRALFLLAAGLAYLSLVGWRLLARLAFRRGGLHARTHRVVIMGAGLVGRQLQEQIRRNRLFGLELVGFLDDKDQTDPISQSDILGPLDSIRRVVIERNIADVIIALPRSAYERLNQAVSLLHDLPVRVWVIPDYFSLTLHHAQVEDFAGIPMLDLRAPALTEYQRMVKRAFDLTISLLALPVALPLMALSALAIKLEDGGPVLYRAARAGENGQIFNMLKFRSMIPDADKLLHTIAQADSSGKLIHKLPNDPRVTKVGRFLRSTSLDELPQLFNILRGEMSLVGPRPELPQLVEKYDLWQRKRFAVPQGLTGWWQINGRSDKPMHLHTEEDLYYVQNYSIWLDLQILVRTAWVVLRRKGAF